MIRLKNTPTETAAPGQKAQAPIKSGNQARAEQTAESLAIEALGFIAGDEKRLERFFAVSGLTPETLRRAARAPGFLAGTLSFLLDYEPDLLEFCRQSGRKPESIARAFAALPGGRPFSA